MSSINEWCRTVEEPNLRPELNLFSAMCLKSIEINKASEEDRAELKRKVIELLVTASKQQSQQVCIKARKLLEVIKESLDPRYKKIYVEARLVDRGLVGVKELFGLPAFEVGMLFDPYLNLPVIPGSTMKGAIRSIFRREVSDDEQVIEEIFGSTNKVGSCMFSDAYPIKPGYKGYILYPDVLNPHYPEDLLYEHEVETRPVVYLTIAPETTFGFVIAIKRDLKEEHIRGLRRAILMALGLGVGAKTSVGYGRFEITALDMEV